MKSRNFSAQEIAKRKLDTSVLENIAFYQMGKMQAIVDYLTFNLKQPITCVVTSGYRDPAFNKTVGGVENSNHVWRVENNYIKCAGDYRFFNKDTKLQIPCSVIYPLLKCFGGEIYWHVRKDFIHIAEQETNEPHFIKGT